MLNACRKITNYTAGRTFEEFVATSMLYDAVIRNLEVIGEAAKGVPDDVRRRHGEIAWRKLAGLRDVRSHRYFGLEDETLWDIVHRSVPELLGRLERIPANTP